MARRTPWPVAASARLYRLLLLAYPANYRRQFGPAMAQVFRDCCAHVLREAGLPGLGRFWLVTLRELVPTALAEHRAAAAPPLPVTPFQRARRCRDRSVMMWPFRRSPRTDPFARFTDRARHVLTLAQAEARSLDHAYLGTEHLLLGLIREERGVASSVLKKLGVRAPEVRRAVEQIIGHGRGEPALCEMCLTPRSKRVLQLAVEEAKRLRHDHVGTEHLLLGLVREGEGVGAGVLGRLGVDLARTRTLVQRALRGPAADLE